MPPGACCTIDGWLDLFFRFLAGKVSVRANARFVNLSRVGDLWVGVRKDAGTKLGPKDFTIVGMVLSFYDVE